MCVLAGVVRVSTWTCYANTKAQFRLKICDETKLFQRGLEVRIKHCIGEQSECSVLKRSALCFELQSTVCPTLDKVLEHNQDKLESIMEEMKQILTPMSQKWVQHSEHFILWKNANLIFLFYFSSKSTMTFSVWNDMHCIVWNREAVIKHSLVHKVFLDFFLHAPAKQRTVSSYFVLIFSVLFTAVWWFCRLFPAC